MLLIIIIDRLTFFSHYYPVLGIPRSVISCIINILLIIILYYCYSQILFSVSISIIYAIYLTTILYGRRWLRNFNFIIRHITIILRRTKCILWYKLKIINLFSFQLYTIIVFFYWTLDMACWKYQIPELYLCFQNLNPWCVWFTIIVDNLNTAGGQEPTYFIISGIFEYL